MLTVNSLSIDRKFSGEVVGICIKVIAPDNEIVFQIQNYDNRRQIVYKGERVHSLDELNSLLERDGYGSVTRNNVKFITNQYIRDHDKDDFFGF